jgi:tRNA(Ile)-lysidine synthetase-like protein
LRADSDMILARPGEPFHKLPLALQRRRLREQLYADGIDATFELVEHLRLKPETPINIGPEQLVSRDAAGTLKASKPLHWNADSLSASLAKAGSIDFGGLTLRWSFGKAKAGRGREHFDADRIGERILLRHWQPGDRFQPIGMKKSAKLQDIFTNCKISRDRRRQLVVAATEKGDIFWVEGLRIAERFKIEPSTKRRLQWWWHRHETC